MPVQVERRVTTQKTAAISHEIPGRGDGEAANSKKRGPN